MRETQRVRLTGTARASGAVPYRAAALAKPAVPHVATEVARSSPDRKRIIGLRCSGMKAERGDSPCESVCSIRHQTIRSRTVSAVDCIALRSSMPAPSLPLCGAQVPSTSGDTRVSTHIPSCRALKSQFIKAQPTQHRKPNMTFSEIAINILVTPCVSVVFVGMRFLLPANAHLGS